MNPTKENFIELNITTIIILGTSLTLGIILHWTFFLIGIIIIGIQRYYTTNEREVQKWINQNLTKKPKNQSQKREIRK